MSQMAMSSQRSSVFTFESTVHSSHVLRWLDEQRCRDMLCDVTVVVEGQSFRAHRSVLASCSDYFAQRISALTQHGAVITLPDEVTVSGFEPLLKFAYTSKLHFGKDNVLDIQNSASILGFQDLDEACFDFLPPKFFSRDSVPFLRKTCCEKKLKKRSSKKDCATDSDDMLLDDKEVKPVADSSPEQEAVEDIKKSECNKLGSQNSAESLAPVTEEIKDHFTQCPKYRKFQIACGKEPCVPKSLNPAMSGIMDDCSLACLPCSNSTNQTGNTTLSSCRQSGGRAEETWQMDVHEIKAENCGNMWGVDVLKKDTENNVMKFKKETEHISGISSSNSTKTVLCESSSALRLDYSPLRSRDNDPAVTRSLEHETFVIDIKKSNKARNWPLKPDSIYHSMQVEAEGKGADNTCIDGGEGKQKGNMIGAVTTFDNTRMKCTVEKEVTEYFPKELGSDKGNSHPSSQDPAAGRSTDTEGMWVQNSSSDCPTRSNNFSSAGGSSCPFLQDLDQLKCSWRPAGMSECEGASQSGVSSVNSGEDGDSETETEGDSESSARERARQVQLPFPVQWIINLSRNDFQQLLKQHVFTREQLDFVHDMRRRSKNRLAAQRCRKRKLDCIYNLQCEINKLKTEREKLMMEKSHLSQLKLKTCHSFTALCQRVCNKANLQAEQLQVLARHSASDCPLSSLFPQIDTLLAQHGLPLNPQTSLLACAGGPNEASQEDTSSSSRETVTGQRTL
ncbi:transcription regulator protein BACH1b [Menidia menidia]